MVPEPTSFVIKAEKAYTGRFTLNFIQGLI